MNRKDFMKLVGAGLLAACLPRLENEMQLGDIWEKIANNARLTGEELAFLKRSGNETQNRNNFVGGNTTPGGALNVPTPFFPIYSEVLQRDTASLTIQIPSGYKQLEISGNGRSSAATGGTVFLQFNGDTTATNYQWTYILGNGSSASSGQDISDPHIPIGQFSNSGDAAGSASSFFCRIPHYYSGFTKMTLAQTYYNDNTTRALYAMAGKWLGTAKISQIEIYATDNTSTKGTSNLVAGSLISVYGIL